MSQPRSLSRNWLLLSAVLSLPVRSLAAAESPSCGSDSQCRSHLDQAVEFDLARKYEAALHEFQAAHKLQKDPRLAVNIGRTLHKLGRFAEALAFYKDASCAAPADTELQKQVQEFTAQAKQNLPASPVASAPVTVVNQPTFAVQTAPMNVTSTATSINNIKIDLGTLLSGAQPVHEPLYKRASLWVPLVGLVLAAGTAGVVAATLPHPWQPDSQIPVSFFSAVTAGVAK